MSTVSIYQRSQLHLELSIYLPALHIPRSAPRPHVLFKGYELVWFQEQSGYLLCRYTGTSVGKMSEEVPITSIQVPTVTGGTREGSVIRFGFNFSAATADFKIAG